MKSWGWALVAGSLWVTSASAGELLLENGSRLEAELADQILVVRTAGGPVEVAARDVAELTRDGVLLRDGRSVRGTLEGPGFRALTSLGELAIRPEGLRQYRASLRSAGAATSVVTVRLPAPTTQSTSDPAAAAPEPASQAQPNPGPATVGGNPLPALASYQDPASKVARPETNGKPASIVTSTSASASGSDSRRWLEVVADSVLLRDAYAAASRVGRVVRGQQVMLVDYIDRRLRILNTLVLDGGYWIKVRVPDGHEGWIPADTVREAR